MCLGFDSPRNAKNILNLGYIVRGDVLVLFYFFKSEVGARKDLRVARTCAHVLALFMNLLWFFNQLRVRHERPLTRPCSAFLHLSQPKHPIMKANTLRVEQTAQDVFVLHQQQKQLKKTRLTYIHHASRKEAQVNMLIWIC